MELKILLTCSQMGVNKFYKKKIWKPLENSRLQKSDNKYLTRDFNTGLNQY